MCFKIDSYKHECYFHEMFVTFVECIQLAVDSRAYE
jgi:hypothetical protein